MKKLLSAAVEGFVGSFKLAAALVCAVVAVASSFVTTGRPPAPDHHTSYHS